MPSLIPKAAPVYPVVDLREAFSSDFSRATRDRAVSYIGRVYDASSNRSEEERENPFQIVEEFDLFMPTSRAYFDELRLAQGILEHAAGRLSDLEIKAVLDAYVESHVYVYRQGIRTVKCGDWETWAECDLFYLTCPKNKKIAFTCNEVQAWLVKLLNQGTYFEVRKL